MSGPGEGAPPAVLRSPGPSEHVRAQLSCLDDTIIGVSIIDVTNHAEVAMGDFVRRDHEIASLTRLLDQVRGEVGTAEPGRCLLMRGRRRIGKSALTEEFVLRADVPGALLRGRGRLRRRRAGSVPGRRGLLVAPWPRRHGRGRAHRMERRAAGPSGCAGLRLAVRGRHRRGPRPHGPGRRLRRAAPACLGQVPVPQAGAADPHRPGSVDDDRAQQLRQALSPARHRDGGSAGSTRPSNPFDACDLDAASVFRCRLWSAAGSR